MTQRPRPARRPRRLLPLLTVLAVTSPLALAACAGGDEGSGSDPESWYESYDGETDGETDGDAAAGAPAPSAADESQPLVPPVEPTEVPAPDEDNTFVEAGSNGFVPTAEDSRSTFALDVDTGSIGVARSLLADGYAVPAAAVRPEEWVNSLSYDDPAPTRGDLGVTAETGLAPTLDDGTQVVRVGVRARDVDPDDRPPVNVTLVVDRSGSMDVRDRLGLVQSSLALMADELRPDDTVAVVSFDDGAVPILGPTPVRDREAVLGAVEELTPGGGTNLEAGLREGYRTAREAFDPDETNLVVLCSDGVANIGSTGPGSIAETIAEQGREGIALVTVGFGMGNYDDHMMEQLADTGDGFYSYVDTYEEAERLFGTELTTTLVPVAAEARAQVAFDPGLVSSYRLVGYENRDLADEDFTDLGVDAGELGAGHHATALYEVRLADGVEPGTRIGEATVLWRPTGPGTEEAEPQEARAELVAADPGAEPSDDLALATAAADLAQLLEDASPYAERGVSLDDLDARLDELRRAEGSAAAGAEQLAELVDLARRTR
ncbi:vWA domain-containing protein [Nocardioides litoris]|uniref:vWA domain-containing protein n=1 Tax=Nocardioides litoris TaxID=1926648 RepID=UPI00112193B5|nr:von Willebrand factor type A domain-containing protein [Nocardioides litoris]